MRLAGPRHGSTADPWLDEVCGAPASPPATAASSTARWTTTASSTVRWTSASPKATTASDTLVWERLDATGAFPQFYIVIVN
jgi:hypothetical protein